LSVFTRSDTDAAWDDNDFSSVVVDAAQCPPAVFVDATWPHEADWQDADPSEANGEQTHFTLDSYSSGDLTNKEITATIELVDDQRGPNATAGGYIVSLVSVSSFDRIVVVEPVVDPDAAAPMDAGADAGDMDAAPQTVTETGYTEAESSPDERITLRHVGDRATVRFTLPMKTEEVDSYDPARAIKVNLRFYNMFTSSETDVVTVTDAGLDASADASIPDTMGEGPGQVYDYLTSRFAISKFTITDVGGTPAQ
jgi:hypothetical protein